MAENVMKVEIPNPDNSQDLETGVLRKGIYTLCNIMWIIQLFAWN